MCFSIFTLPNFHLPPGMAKNGYGISICRFQHGSASFGSACLWMAWLGVRLPVLAPLVPSWRFVQLGHLVGARLSQVGATCPKHNHNRAQPGSDRLGQTYLQAALAWLSLAWPGSA